MHLLFQPQAEFRDGWADRNQVFPLIVDTESSQGDPYSDKDGSGPTSGWGYGWIPYDGRINTYCYSSPGSGNIIAGASDTRGFLRVQTEWTRHRDGRIVHNVLECLTNRGGGHIAI